MRNLTKIVATLGPTSEEETTVRAMVEAGMNVARINCSHGDWDARRKRIQLVRALSKELKVPIAILVDLQGPKIRTGDLPDGVIVETGDKLHLVVDESKANYKAKEKKIFIRNYPELPKEVEAGHKILLDDGLIRLEVKSSNDDSVEVEVTVGGLIKSNKGVNLPESKQENLKAITDKDKEDLKEAVKAGADFIALSFVREAEDIIQLKELIAKENPVAPIKIIGKIEKPQAVQHLAEILDVVDGVMVARGDLGVELEPEQVPMVQKDIIARANRKNKIVITATQMMDSMIKNPFPTRAEVSDVANAIIDGTDAVMLSAETASGAYPIKAVEYMAKVALEVESNAVIRDDSVDVLHTEANINRIAIAEGINSFVKLRNVKNIIAFSCSGATVQMISKARTRARIIAATTYQHTYNYLAMVWGVRPFFFNEVEHTTKTFVNLEEKLLKQGLVEKNETIIVSGGLPIAARQESNFIKFHKCDGSMKEIAKITKAEDQKELGPQIAE